MLKPENIITNENIDDYLFSYIERESEKIRKKPSSFINNILGQSAFKLITLAPTGNNITAPLKILIKRNTPENKKRLLLLFNRLPWGDDSYPTLILTELFAKSNDADYHNALRERLKTSNSEELTLIIIYGLYKINKIEAVNTLIGRLKDPLKNKMRQLYMITLDNWLSLFNENEREEISKEFDFPDISSWNGLYKAYLDRIIKKHKIPTIVKKFANSKDLFAYIVTKAFEKVRIDHIGCSLTIPIFFGVWWVIMFALDKILGKPEKWLINIEYATVFLWLLVVIITSTTHFKGFETLEDLYNNAKKYWLALFLCLFTIIAAHTCF